MPSNENSSDKIRREPLTSEVEIELAQVLQRAGIPYRPGPIAELLPDIAKGERHQS
jgi:hypothetical protein